MQKKKLLFLALTLTILFYFNPIMGQNKKAIDSIQTEIAKKQSVSSLVDNYFALAQQYCRFDVKKANITNTKIWTLSKKINYKKGFAHFFFIKSYISIVTYKYELSKINAQKSSEIYLKQKDTAGYLEAKYNFILCLSNTNKIDESLAMTKAALKFTKSKKFIFQIAKLNYSLGTIYKIKNDLKNALLYFNIALSYYRQSKVSQNYIILICYTEIAQVYQKTKEYNKALEYMMLSIETATKINYIKNDILNLYSIVSSIYIDKEDYKSALKYLHIANEMNESLQNKDQSSLITNMLAYINLKQKKYDLGIVNARKAIVLSEYEENKVLGYQILGNCFFAKKQYNRANEFQKKVVNFIENSKTKSSFQINFFPIYEEIAKTKNAQGNHKEAYEYSLLNKEISDKIANEEKTNRINELQTKFEVSEKEIALKNSLFEKQKKDIEIQKQNSYISIISAILLTTILIAFLLIRIYLINKRKNKQLQFKNIVIENTNTELNQSKIELEKLLSEKDVLLKEIHHRVKNNLQIIISLLNIQSRSGKSISTDEFIEKSLARITSMSLVHQNLYQNESIEKVNFNDYLNNLTKSIATTFVETEERIKVKIDCDDIFFKIETAIPLGLIINELMYNMYKHAFPESAKGIIEIIFKKTSHNYQLTLKDNGVGFNETIATGKSMGLKLVKLLSSQINATFEKINSEKTAFVIQFTETNNAII